MHRPRFKPRVPSSSTNATPARIYRRNEERRMPTTPLLASEHCPIKTRCGACAYVNQDYKTGLSDKHQKGLALMTEAGVLPPSVRQMTAVPGPRPLGYRSLFKLAVRPTPAGAPEGSRFALGLFAPGSHDIVAMNDCPLHVGALQRLIPDLTAEFDASPLTPYNETTGAGQIRYVAARAAHLTGELMVTVVVTTPLKNELRRIIEALRRRGHKINIAAMNINTGSGNAIFGPETLPVAGSDKLRERVCDLDFEISPTAFFQINPWQAINLYRRVEQVAGPAGNNETAWDLYCGSGQIALILARLGYRTLGIEENPAAIADAKANAKKNKLDKQADFIAARVEDAEPLLPAWGKNPSLIVANPSRRGLADSARQHLVWLGNQTSKQVGMRLIYVSCSAESLARDLKDLVAGGFTVRQVEAFDMFPQTEHMEWVAVLTR